MALVVRFQTIIKCLIVFVFLSSCGQQISNWVSEVKVSDEFPSLSSPVNVIPLSGEPTGTNSLTLLNISVGGSDIVSYKYKIIVFPYAIDCSSSLGYSSDVVVATHVQDNIGALADGEIRVCLVGKNSSGVYQDYTSATVVTWTKDTTAPAATISGEPTGTNNTTVLNVTIAGTDVANYKYKVGVTGSTDCTSATGYSADVAVGTHITDNISALADGSITLCVVGKDSAGNYQAYASSTSASWTKLTAGATPIYRSVGPDNESILACGTTGGGCTGQGNLTMSASTATFASALANKIGVGDAIIYDCNGNLSLGAGDCVAFIYARASSTSYTVKNKSGAAPTAYSANTKWRIYRAYTHLTDASNGSENPAIDAINSTLGNFDTFAWNTDHDIVSSNEQWNITLYADAIETTPGYFSSRWVTDATHDVHIYTPTSSNEVGVSQRHTGTWGTGYQLITGGTQAILLPVNNVQVDGVAVELDNSCCSAVQFSVADYPTANPVYKFSNSIVRVLSSVDGVSGISAYNGGASRAAKMYIYNNLVYWAEIPPLSAANNVTISNGYPGSTFYVYNNTLIGGTFENWSGVAIVAKNNIVQGCAYLSGSCFYGTFSNSDYNISDDSTSSGGAHDQVNTKVLFVDPHNKDYRLSVVDYFAKDQGISLAADPDLAFSTDFLEATRTTWDIGVNEATGATPIYRSVGPSKTTSLAGGVAGVNSLSITANGVATFDKALPNKIGVGDAIQYTSNGSTTNQIAFIYARFSDSKYIVRSASGALPVASTAATQIWKVYRAYTSLANAVDYTFAGTENTGINATVRNFDNWSNGVDLVAGNQNWNVALYADTTDTAAVNINGWGTGLSNYLNIFTPTLSNEVGESQRHLGYWGNVGYSLSTSGNPGVNSLFLQNSYIRIDGLMIKQRNDLEAVKVYTYGPSGIQISNSVIDTNSSVNSVSGINIFLNSASDVIKIYNNIVYDLGSAAYDNRAAIYNWTGTAYVYNNTLRNFDNGLVEQAGSNVLAKNNIAITNGNSNAYSGTFVAGSKNNLASDATTAGTNSFINKTVNFVDTTNYNYLLSSTDVNAKANGANLISDANLMINTDILGNIRDAWDIGASNATPPVPQFLNIAYGANDSFVNILTVPVPSGVANGDLLIMMVGGDNASAWQTPAGWTPLYADAYPGADGANFNTYYRIASSEPVSYDVTNGTPGSTASAAGWIAAWRGVHQTTPINIQSHSTSYQTDAATTKTVTAPSATTTANNCLAIYIGYVDQNTVASMSFNVPSGYRTLGTQQQGNNWVTSTLGQMPKLSPGATGAASATFNNGILNSSITSGVGAMLIVIQPP